MGRAIAVGFALLMISGAACTAESPQRAADPTRPTPSSTAVPSPGSESPSISGGPRLLQFVGRRLREVDLRTLDPIDGRVVRFEDWPEVGFTDGANYVLSPDGRSVAVPGLNSGQVTVVRLPALTVAARFPALHGRKYVRPELELVSWPRPHVLIGYSRKYGANRSFPSTIRILDPVRQEVIRTIPVDGTVAGQTAYSHGRTIFLASPTRRVGPARLVVLDQQGRSRSVGLTESLAGHGPGPHWPQETADPGLAVRGSAVYVVGQDDRVAQVHLGSGQVDYHEIQGLQPVTALGEPGFPGTGGVSWRSYRTVDAIGRHLLLITTFEERPATEGTETQSYGRPSALVDSRTWQVVRSFPEADEVWAAQGLLFAYRGSAERPQRSTLSVTTPGGRQLFELRGRAGRRWETSAGRLIGRDLDGSRAVLIDLANGEPRQRLGHVPFPFQLFVWNRD
jgi:hypothetical protein